MSHCPATAWRDATLRIAELDSAGGETGRVWLTGAGRYADDNASVIATSQIRHVAEGVLASMCVGAAPAYCVTLASPEQIGAAPAQIGAAATSRAATPEPHVTLPRWAALEAAQEINARLQQARRLRDDAAARREAAIAELTEAHDVMHLSEGRVAELQAVHAQLIAATGAAA